MLALVTLKCCCTFNSVKLLQKESSSCCIWIRNIFMFRLCCIFFSLYACSIYRLRANRAYVRPLVQ